MRGRLRARKHTDPVDKHVGARVRLRRNMLGMSQERLGNALGLTFQQVQKYENGTNRVSASKLYEIARVLSVPVRFFYDATDPVHAAPMTTEDVADDDPLARPDTQALLTAYRAMSSQMRSGFTTMLRAMVASSEGE